MTSAHEVDELKSVRVKRDGESGFNTPDNIGLGGIVVAGINYAGDGGVLLLNCEDGGPKHTFTTTTCITERTGELAEGS